MGIGVYDTIVIGGGYWGSGICHELIKAGKKVLVIDAAYEGSGTKAASGICDPASYKSKVFSKLLPSNWANNPSKLTESFNWLLKVGCYKVRERFWNQFQGREPREGTDCIYAPTFKTITALADPYKIHGIVRKAWIESGVWQITLGGKLPFQSKSLVVAAGIHSGVVLGLCGYDGLNVGALYGRGLICNGNPTTDLPVSTMIRPYCKHTVRTWGNDGSLYKVGDTAEIHPKPSNLDSLYKVGSLCLDEMEVVEVSEGYRPVLDEFTVQKIGKWTQKPPLVLATGGHRVGLGLTGLVAKETLEMLK